MQRMAEVLRGHQAVKMFDLRRKNVLMVIDGSKKETSWGCGPPESHRELKPL
jgi:hypothetical protein